MKKLVTIASVLAILVTPALAGTGKTHRHHTAHKLAQAPAGGYGTGNVLPYQFNPQGQAIPTPRR